MTMLQVNYVWLSTITTKRACHYANYILIPKSGGKVATAYVSQQSSLSPDQSSLPLSIVSATQMRLPSNKFVSSHPSSHTLDNSNTLSHNLSHLPAVPFHISIPISPLNKPITKASVVPVLQQPSHPMQIRSKAGKLQPIAFTFEALSKVHHIYITSLHLCLKLISMEKAIDSCSQPKASYGVEDNLSDVIKELLLTLPREKKL
ncbi:hypothetical protein EZV62_026164 [Acer yangbiense]|uniref:Uncharacterized protein n=1 Tax=Acer yangbiense TaxID=1000413 RepID=A0A5C7GQS4_9ROSI|nr:hypothetical protein EZV62_026164 [Acer yangbiense]